MYAVHPIPLSEVKAICKHTPSFGWQYIIVVLGNGLTLPPLYFSTGGVKGLMSALKQVSCPHAHEAHEQSSCSTQDAALQMWQELWQTSYYDTACPPCCARLSPCSGCPWCTKTSAGKLWRGGSCTS